MDGLHSALHDGMVEVKFTKVDGSERVMKCTLNEALILAPKDTMADGTTHTRPDTVTAVWDIDKSAWRSFRNDSIIAWKVLS